MNINSKLKDRRLELGLTLEEVGNIVGVGKSTVRKWETGAIENMKRDKIALLAKALKVSPSFIMGWDENASENPSSQEFHPELNKKDKKEIDDYIEEMREELINSNSLLFDGEPADEEDIEAILNAMKIGAELVKKKNKEKYTPKKYKK